MRDPCPNEYAHWETSPYYYLKFPIREKGFNYLDKLAEDSWWDGVKDKASMSDFVEGLFYIKEHCNNVRFLIFNLLNEYMSSWRVFPGICFNGTYHYSDFKSKTLNTHIVESICLIRALSTRSIQLRYWVICSRHIGTIFHLYFSTNLHARPTGWLLAFNV